MIRDELWPGFGVGLQVARGELDAGQVMLHQVGIRVSRPGVAEGAVEDTSLATIAIMIRIRIISESSIGSVF